MFWQLPEVSLLGTIRVFHSNAESRFGCASSRRLRLVLWLFTSCVWDVLWYRILIKTAFVSWAKEKLSKTTLSMFQIVFLSSAGLFSLVVTKKICFEIFLRSLCLKQYVFFVQIQSHVLAALFLERYVWYFGSLHPAFEMYWDTEYS